MGKKLKIYFTSDVHGYFYPTTYGDRTEKNVGLFQCASGFEKDEQTLVMDGGDVLQGSAFASYCRQVLQSPKTIAEVMNDCGYDYYTLGNHDFNYGQAYQAEYRKYHWGHCICQNVEDEAGNILYPYEIREMADGLKVGIVGIVTDFINVWEKKENLVGIRITDPFEAAKVACKELKGQVDITVCVYHGGFECELSTGRVLSNTTENIGYRICEELDFDVLLTGHQHMSVDGQMVHGTYVVQPLDNAKEYHYLEIECENGEKTIRSEKRKAALNSENTRETQKNKKSEIEKQKTDLKEKYRDVEDAVQAWLDRPAGHLSRELRPADKVAMALEGSPIADFLNRVQLYFSGAQISAVSLANEVVGFGREVSTRDIIATYPYPNTLMICRINGEQLRNAMERSAEYFATDKNGDIQVAESFLIPKVEHYNYDYYMGVTYEINPAAPVGSRIQNLCYQGKPVQDEDVFTMCLNNYRYSGAGGYPMYPQCPLVREINTEMVELIMEYFHQNPMVEVNSNV
jgi:2',3'-cyclic-nucleotide 2'-phosphodiesterase/3'-nucleotidase